MSNDSNTSDFPAEPARPADIGSEIDRLVGNALSANVRFNYDGTTETLPMPENNMSRSGDVAAPPSIEELGDQMSAQQATIDRLQAKLNEQVYSRSTGQPEGPRVTGRDRELLVRQQEQARDEINYLAALLMSTSEARIAWNQARAAQAAGSEATPTHDAMAQAARRETAIRELAEMPGPDGKPVGRMTAAREYDAAQLRSRADKLARG